MPRLNAWTEYSRSHPPLHLMVASYLGIKPAAKPSAATNEETAAFLFGMPELTK